MRSRDHPARCLPLALPLALALAFSSGCIPSLSHAEYRAHDEPILAVAVSQDGAHIASASTDRTVVIWHRVAAQLVATLRGHNGWVTDIAFNPSLPELASAGNDGNVIFWSTETWQQTGTPLALAQPIWAIAYSPDGSRLAVALDDGSISLRDTATLAELALLSPQAERTNSVAFSPDGTQIVASHGGTSSLAISATVWGVPSGRQLAVLSAHGPTAESLATSQPDLAEDLLDNGVTWGSVNDATFSPDGELIATVGEDGAIFLWDASTWEVRGSIKMPPTYLTTSSFAKSGRSIFAGGSLGNATVRDTATLEQLFALPQAGADLNDAAFTPDDQFIVAGYYDGVVRIWPIPSVPDTPE